MLCFSYIRTALLLTLWLFASTSWALTPEQCGTQLRKLPRRTELAWPEGSVLQLEALLADPLRTQREEVQTNGGEIISTERLAREGHLITPQLLLEIGVPASLHRFYDPKTGVFHYLPARQRLLSSENGDETVTTLHFNIPQNIAGQLGLKYLAPDFERVLQRDQSVKIFLAIGSDQRESLEKWRNGLPARQKERVRVVVAPVHEAALDWWAQDGSKPAAQEGGGSVMLIPRGPIGAENSFRYEGGIQALLQSGVANVDYSPFRFEGGNLIVGARHVFVGSNVIEAAMKDFRIPRSAAIQALGLEFGKEIIEAGVPSAEGGKIQPVFHVDLSFALVRDRRTHHEVVVMEDPSLAMEIILGTGTTKSRENFEKAREAWFIKQPPGFTSFERQDFATSVHSLTWESLQYRLRQQAFLRQQFEAKDYRVQAIAGLTGLSAGKREGDFAIPLNYTNVILSGEKAYVPKTGNWGLDAAALRTYRDFGYDVVPMPSAAFLYCANGGTRCGAQTFR